MLNTTTDDFPRFSHDCECCAYVGRAFDGDKADGDVWVCLRHKELILRFSDRPDHYMARGIADFGQIFGDLKIWGIVLAIFRQWQRYVAAI